MIRSQHLTHALGLAEHGSFRRAARAAGLSQPALSRSIARLEKELGVCLFDRTPGGAVPTAFGEVLISRARAIVSASTELEREIRLLSGLRTGELNVVFGPYPAEMVGHRAVGRLIGEHSDLRCRVTVTDWRTAANQVLNREVDIALSEVSEFRGEERLEIEALFHHPFVFFARAGHPLAGRKQVTRQELDGFPLVLLRLPERMKHVIPGKGSISPVTGDFLPSVNVESVVLSRQIVAESEGFSAACPIQIEAELRSGEFTVLDFAEPWMKLNYGFIHLKGRTMSPAAREFQRIVKDLEEEVRKKNDRLLREFRSKRRGRPSGRTPTDSGC